MRSASVGCGYAAGELRDLNDLSFCSPNVILLAGSHSTAPCCSPAIPFHVGHTVHEAFTHNPTHLASTISPTSFCAIQSDGTDFAPSQRQSHTHAHTHTHTHTHAHKHSYAHRHAHTHTCAHTHTPSHSSAQCILQRCAFFFESSSIGTRTE